MKSVRVRLIFQTELLSNQSNDMLDVKFILDKITHVMDTEIRKMLERSLKLNSIKLSVAEI